MLVASKLIPGGRGLAAPLVRRAAVVELDWDTRQKSRFDAVDSGGRRLGVVLPRGSSVRGGDVLVAEDGSLVAVRAAVQPLLVVTVGAGGAPLDLLRAAYHLGNRHVPLEVRADRLQLEPDHVLAELLERMGLTVAAASGAFEPEAGAYQSASSPPGHAQRGGAGHGHEHEHRHEHERGHAHGDASAGHAHGDASAGHVHGDASAAHVHGDASAAHVHGDASAAHVHGDGSAEHVHGAACGHADDPRRVGGEAS